MQCDGPARVSTSFSSRLLQDVVIPRRSLLELQPFSKVIHSNFWESSYHSLTHACQTPAVARGPLPHLVLTCKDTHILAVTVLEVYVNHNYMSHNSSHFFFTCPMMASTDWMLVSETRPQQLCDVITKMSKKQKLMKNKDS